MTAARITIALACLMLLGANGPADQLAKAQREAAKSAARIRQLDQSVRSAVDQADQFNARAAALAARVQQAESYVAASEARVALIDAAIVQRRRSLAERQKGIIHLLAALESLSRRPPALALVQPGSVRDTTRVALLLDGVLPIVRQRTADLRHELTALQKLKDGAVAARLQLANAGQRLDDGRQLLVRLEQDRRQTATKIATESMLESDRALALSVEAKDLRQLLGTLNSQSRLRERLASLPGPLPRPLHIPSYALPPPQDRYLPEPVVAAAGAQPVSGFVLPALGEVATGFGELSPAGVRSRGLTLRTREKALVIAPAAGRIAFAGPFREYGNIVIVEHRNGLTTLLAGLDKLNIKVGQKVAAGGPVGQMGTNRRELTLEIRDNGQPVNPLPLVTVN